jgi:integrase
MTERKNDGVVVYRGKTGTTTFRIKFRDSDGVQCMETVGTAREGMTRTKAAKIRRQRLGDVDKGWKKPTALTFAEYAESWFAQGEAKRGWKPGTVKVYGITKRRLIDEFGQMPLGAIAEEHVAAYIAGSKLGASTVRRDASCLHAIFRSARKAKLVQSNPAADAELPKLPKRRWRLLKPGEFTTLSRAFSDERARMIFLTLALTGLRRSEVRGLRWANVSLTEARLQVVESKSDEGERHVALTPMLVRELEAWFARTPYRSDTDYVFAHPRRGSPADFCNWYPGQWRKALKAAGVTDYIRPCHDQRHTALTNLAAGNASGPQLMAIAGHRSYATTKKYIDLAGVVFHDQAAALEQRLVGDVSTTVSTNIGASQPV